ncbi:MAG: hypothetical protein E7G24_11850, partial [Clostridium celatum]|nr:hypothetical protein [Clostridium celatum]
YFKITKYEVLKMNKNIEIMKKLIEEKKSKGTNSNKGIKPQKSIGKVSKGARTGNGGGLFDK